MMPDVSADTVRRLGVLEFRSELTFLTHFKIEQVLNRAEGMTLSWLDRTIKTGRSIILVKSFKLPLQPVLRKHYRDFYKRAYVEGGRAVFESVPKSPILRFTGKQSHLVLAHADLAMAELVSRIERDLRHEWGRSIGRKVDRPMLNYQTKRIFADVVGKPRPQGL